MARQSYPLATKKAPELGMPPASELKGDPLSILRHVRAVLWKMMEWTREIMEVANGVREGKINSVGDVTLTASATTTTLTDLRIGSFSVILFMPTTANAAAAAAALYVSARTQGSATLTHASSANSDQTFSYAILGG